MGKNNQVFEQYADFYDDYYVSKDYENEVSFVLSLASLCGLENFRNVLDIGCGTGGHLLYFAKAGIKSTGFDLSDAMVKIAQQKLKKLGRERMIRKSLMPVVKNGDARSYRDGKKYDLVVSMFAAMGYLATNKDFLDGLKTARAHLNKKGLFIFDVWFGPTVIAERPETRVQEFTKDGKKTIRMVNPGLNVIRQTATIKYKILQLDGKKIAKEVNEAHEMRFFFAQELRLLLEQAGFSLLKVCPFMDDSRDPVLGDWNISVVAQAR